MHESIAKPLYRGFTRKLLSEAFNPLVFPQPTKRAAWMRSVQRKIRQSKRFIQIGPQYLWNEGKKSAELIVFGVSIATNVDDPKRTTWIATVIEVNARDYSFTHKPLILRITTHMVERMMQRLDVSDPVWAIRSLHLPMQTALELTPTKEGILLPHEYGAVVAQQDENDPESWVFITFLSKNQLTPHQNALVLENYKKASNNPMLPTMKFGESYEKTFVA